MNLNGTLIHRASQNRAGTEMHRAAGWNGYAYLLPQFPISLTSLSIPASRAHTLCSTQDAVIIRD